ncbi:hypothetical protein GCM10009678_11470 [Actinomadura kijaniata]|uniref:MYXO-CTERM domain-containing protein n=1 Tax=Actinomadura namibiensis TaxID=182080 RepID=A0A7W3LN94_ACTNM|nr:MULTISPECIES: DUF3618 domain-containing protein [Actinomadura]MBA8951275.1 MYXO-CTERM domain-containing protein [Actinomadura namibiensis]
MADRSRDPEALEREIERTRQELARTIDELADRVNPRNVVDRGKERLKEEADQVVRTVRSMVTVPDGDGGPGQLDQRVVVAGAVAVVALTALVLLRRRRR